MPSATRNYFVLIVALPIIAYATLPIIREPPPPERDRKEIVIKISGEAQSTEKGVEFHKELSLRMAALFESSSYFASVSLDDPSPSSKALVVHVRYWMRYVALGKYSANPGGLWVDFMDFETQAVCCFSASISPYHETYQIGIRLEIPDAARNFSKEKCWGAWSYQPFLIPIYTNRQGRLRDVMIDLAAEALEEARRSGAI